MLFAACAAAFAACSKDQTETVTPDTPTVTFRFSADTDPKTDQSAMNATTRTEFDENYQLKWCSSDEIGLFIASADPTNNAEATPDLTISPTVFEASVNPYSVGDKVYAYYPYDPAQTSTTVALTVPAAQESPALDKFNGAYNPLVAIPTETTDSDTEYAMIEQLCFRQTAAMAAFNIYTSTEEYVDETIESISYTNTGSDAPIAGTFSVDLTAVPARGDMPAIESIENGSKTIEVNFMGKGYLLDVNDKETNIVYMSVLPGEYEGTVVVTTNKATYTFPAKKPLPLPRAYVRKIALDLAKATRQLRPFYEIKGVMGSSATKNAWTGWTFANEQTGNNIFGIRLGSSSAQGSATSPAIKNFPEKIEVTINAVAWDGTSENTTLIVSLLNEDETVNAQKNIGIEKQKNFSGNSPSVSEAAIMSADNRHSVIFYAGGGTKKVRIEAQNSINNRFALAYVAIAATDAEILVPPTISADDITGIPEEGVIDATFDFSVENDREYTAAVEFDGTVVTKAAVENRTVTYTVSENTGDAREGWITISLNDEAKTQKKIKVAQEATSQKLPEVTFVPSDFSSSTLSATKTGITATFKANEGQTPRISNSDPIRMYAKNQLEIGGVVLRQISFTYDQAQNLDANVGTINTSGSVATWTSPADSDVTSVLFTNNASAQARISKITVIYEEDKRIQLDTPTITETTTSGKLVTVNWNTVTGAADYTVTCGTLTQTASVNSATFTMDNYATDYRISVVANPADATKYRASEPAITTVTTGEDPSPKITGITWNFDGETTTSNSPIIEFPIEGGDAEVTVTTLNKGSNPIGFSSVSGFELLEDGTEIFFLSAGDNTDGAAKEETLTLTLGDSTFEITIKQAGENVELTAGPTWEYRANDKSELLTITSGEGTATWNNLDWSYTITPETTPISWVGGSVAWSQIGTTSNSATQVIFTTSAYTEGIKSINLYAWKNAKASDCTVNIYINDVLLIKEASINVASQASQIQDNIYTFDKVYKGTLKIELNQTEKKSINFKGITINPAN